MLRIVLNTNIALVGLLWRGKPYELLGLALAGKVQCFATEPLITELTRLLGYTRFAKRIESLDTSIAPLVADYRSLVEVAPAADITPTIIADPDDDNVLACAIAAGTDLVVSSDAHLLNLKQYHGIDLLTPTRAHSRIEASTN